MGILTRERSCTFTGHRPDKLPWRGRERDPRCVALKGQLASALEQVYALGYRHFLCGMALGSDLYFAEAVLELRARRPEVTLEAVIPFAQQPKGWSPENRRRYGELLARCDVETLLQQEYDPGCFQRRNRYMVDHCSRMIAVYNGDPAGSGTLSTLTYALRSGVEVDILPV